MSYHNTFCPVWEAPTTSDTAAQNYYGLWNNSSSTATVVFKSESTGSDITAVLQPGQQIVARIVLIKTTGTSGTFVAGRPY